MDSLESAIHYSRAAVSYILRRYPHDVEDVLQNAALKAWRGMASFRGDSAFTSWFHRIAIREALMFLRGKTPQGRFKWREVEEDKASHVPDVKPGPWEQAVAGDVRRVVLERIAGLTPALRLEARRMIAEGNEAADYNDGNRKANRFRMRRRLAAALAKRGIYVMGGN